VAAGLLLTLAAALPGCDRPEGLGTVDAEAGRQGLVARGRPDPLAAAGASRFQMPPAGRKRGSAAHRR
jgi:hypothetical protein